MHSEVAVEWRKSRPNELSLAVLPPRRSRVPRASRRRRGNESTCCRSNSGRCARELGPRKLDGDGFDFVDASRELARLASNHDRAINPDGRTADEEKDDWVRVGGLGADLGNMADERVHADDIRPIAHELCYLACDYLF